MKICITGDSILMAPFPENYAGFDAVKAHIAQADVRINNLEMVISEGDKFASTYCGGIWLTGKPERLDDVCSYGFKCFGFMGTGAVGAGDDIALFQHQTRKAGHGAAAYAEKVNSFSFIINDACLHLVAPPQYTHIP